MSAPQNPDRANALATLLHLLEAVTQPVRVTVRGERGHLLSVTIPPPAPAPRPLPDDERDCQADILAVLREAGRRMTTNQILSELSRRGWVHGDSTVKSYLSEMVTDGDVSKDPRAHPPGYAPA
jgi:hypothetical protein